jgi:HlyD family secretion protein
MPEGIAKSNGRVEATQVDVAAKYPGRLEEVTAARRWSCYAIKSD